MRLELPDGETLHVDPSEQVFSYEDKDGTQYFWRVSAGYVFAQARNEIESLSLSQCGMTLEQLLRQYTDLDLDYALTTDLNAPLLLVPLRDEFVLIDGSHRAAKALLQGIDTLPAYFLTQEEADAILLLTLPPEAGLDWGNPTSRRPPQTPRNDKMALTPERRPILPTLPSPDRHYALRRLFSRNERFADYPKSSRLNTLDTRKESPMELPLKTVRLSIPTLTALFDALPSEHKTTEIQRQLTAAYYREVERIIAAVMHPDCQEPQAVMHLWRTAGEPPRQWITEFHVSDLALPKGNAINWHGQQTSQWRYAGAIVVQDGEVSTHH